MKTEQIINLVILGCGTMGDKLLKRFFHPDGFKKTLENKGIKVHLFAIIDKDEELRKSVAEYLSDKKLEQFPQLYPTLDDFIKKSLLSSPPEESLLVYDATPTQYHFNNLEAIKFVKADSILKDKVKIFYFGEKPLLIDEDKLKCILEPPTIWCDFIELYSQVFLTLRDFLMHHPDFIIKKIRFWRLSCMGLDKVFTPGKRPGVTGGALEDKMVHDIALTMGILSEGKNKAFGFEGLSPDHFEAGDVKIRSARIPCFMPANVYSIAGNIPLFMTVRGDTVDMASDNHWQWPNMISDPTADAAFILKTQFKRQDTSVSDALQYIDVEYYASWIGCSDLLSFIHVTKNLEVEWVDEETKRIIDKERDTCVKYTFDEVRMCLIEGIVNDGPYTIACNFLHRPKEDKKKNILPEVITLLPNKQKKKVEVPTHINTNETSLDRIFIRVVENLREEKPEPLITNKSIYLVHRLLMDARRVAFEQYYDTSVEAEKANRKFRSFLRIK